MKRNSLSFVLATLALFLESTVLLCQLGCDGDRKTETAGSSDNYSSSTQSDRTQSVAIDNIDGQTILSQSIARYAAASSYQDQAVLYLTYRLEGRGIQEPHPFSTSWQRANRLTSKIFNGQIHCDGQQLGCYIFDIGSANLDNQQLLLPVSTNIPVTQLYRDSIARHFLGGYSELPLDETEKDLPPKLIPPPISLLTGQLPFGWIQRPEKVERLSDATLDERSCYVLRTLHAGSTSDIWIDQQTGLLVQISLPLRLMIREVLTTGEIQDVELLVKFHDATIDGAVDSALFQIPSRADATKVRNFVSIPEPMPCELIGKKAPDFQLFKPTGDTLERQFFAGRTTALLWLGGDPSFDSLGKFGQLCRDLPKTEFEFGAVYSDLELADSQSGSLRPNEKLKAISSSTELPVYYDQQLQASSRLQIKAIPTVIVFDPDSKIQFARALSDDDWQDDLNAALQRVSRGEDIAAEMEAEYQRYIDDYHQQLVLAANEHQNPSESIRGESTGRLIADGFQPGKLQTTLAWSNTNFKQPGNILVDDDGEIFVFDGWRTVVELNPAGQQIARHELELPEQGAISCLRLSNRSSAAKWAAFSVQGQQIYLFDANWKPTAVLPNPDFEHAGIRDAQFADVDANGRDQLVVAFAETRGIYKFDPLERTTSQISQLNADSLVKIYNGVAYCNQSEMGIVGKDQSTASAPAGMSFHGLIQRDAGTVGTEIAATPCVITRDKNQNWFATGFESNGQISWQQPIGSQLFESQIEPVTAGMSVQGKAIFAIADVENRITFISQNGDLLGQHSAAEPICGVALSGSTAELKLFVSTANAVHCFRVGSTDFVKPVSSQQ